MYCLFWFAYLQVFAVRSVPITTEFNHTRLFFLVIFYRLLSTWEQTTSWKTWSKVLTEHWHTLPRKLVEFPSLEITKKPSGRGLGQPAPGGPAWAGAWTKWPPEVPSNLSHSVKVSETVLQLCPGEVCLSLKQRMKTQGMHTGIVKLM